MQIELLYFDGCPGHEALLPRLRELIAEVGVDTPVELKQITSVEMAHREHFLGSPTLRIDGADVEPKATGRSDFGLNCRLYGTHEDLRGQVPDELIRAALKPDR